MDIKLPGLNTGNFHVRLPGGEIHITGKWFNYGIIFIVMILDLNMWKNQIFYEPFVYGQYTDDQHYIYTVTDRDFLANATRTTLSYAWRWTHVNPNTNMTYGLEDHKMNSRYYGLPLRTKGTAFIPSLFAFAMFGILVKYFSKGGPPAKVAPMEENEVTSNAAETRNSSNGVTEDVEDGPSSPRVAMSLQSMSSYKSEFALNKTRNIGSFLSVESSHNDLNVSRDNFDSSRGNLNSSRDNLDSSRDYLDSSHDNVNSSREELRSSRDDLRSSVESVGVQPKDVEQSTASRPAWSANSPMIVLSQKTPTRRSSSATEKSTKCRRTSEGDERDNENMVQELVQELSFLSLDDGESQTKANKPSKKNSISVGDGGGRALSFGDLFRRDSPASSRAQSQESVTASDEEDRVKPEAKPRNNFLQVPKAK